MNNIIIPIILLFSLFSCNKEIENITVLDEINREFMNSIVTQSKGNYYGVHDSQVLVINNDINTFICVIYCTISPYTYQINVYDMLGKLICNHNVLEGYDLGNTGWAPRFIKLNSNTIRVIFTVDKSRVYYRDFNLIDFKFGSVYPFMIRYTLPDGSFSEYVNFTLDIMSKHILNTTKHDIESSNFIENFSDRSLLINGTDQIQHVGDEYFLTAEILADKMINGDCGGISCLVYSNDLTKWTLKPPVYVSDSVTLNRCHEMSMTYLNNKWHGISRNLDGYMLWNSKDGNKWEMVKLYHIPGSVKGYKHSVFVVNNPDQNYAVIAYQRFITNDKISWTDHASQRKSVGVCYTKDFKKFYDIMVFRSDSFMTYPSIYIHDSTFVQSWSSGYSYFTEEIKISKINIKKIIGSKCIAD